MANLYSPIYQPDYMAGLRGFADTVGEQTRSLRDYHRQKARDQLLADLQRRNTAAYLEEQENAQRRRYEGAPYYQPDMGSRAMEGEAGLSERRRGIPIDVERATAMIGPEVQRAEAMIAPEVSRTEALMPLQQQMDIARSQAGMRGLAGIEEDVFNKALQRSMRQVKAGRVSRGGGGGGGGGGRGKLTPMDRWLLQRQIVKQEEQLDAVNKGIKGFREQIALNPNMSTMELMDLFREEVSDLDTATYLSEEQRAQAKKMLDTIMRQHPAFARGTR